MTNMTSILGGAIWAFVAVLLVSLALEPVSVTPQAQYAQTDSTARTA
jgi:hypothetical protein